MKLRILPSALILVLGLAGVVPAQFRQTTEAERAWDQQVVSEFEKILTNAAGKMSQPWVYKFDPEYHGYQRDEIDVSVCGFLPHELRCSILLTFPGESEAAQKLELEGNRYAEISDSLTAIGQQNTLENPWDRTEIYVDVVVNYYGLAQMAIDTTKLNVNEKILQMPGAVLSVYQVYPGSSSRPTTMCWFGEVPFKSNPSTIPNYSPSRLINRTDVKNVILTIHTAPALAQEFYQNLDVAAIQRIIDNM